MICHMPHAKAIGLIAGYGIFPFDMVEALAAEGFDVHVIAAREETFPKIEKVATSVTWLHVGKIGGMIKALQAKHVHEVVMAGKIRKLHMFRNFRPDFVAVKALLTLPDRRDDSIMLAVAGLLADAGIELISQVKYAKHLIANEGHLFGPKAGKRLLADMQFGLAQARGIAALDIGQTVVVQQQAVLAVEAIEGTDEAIRRGGNLGNGKAVVIKVAKPNQDLRFDVPAIGPDTLRIMVNHGCKALAIQAGCTLLLEKSVVQDMATQYGIAVYGFSVSDANDFDRQ